MPTHPTEEDEEEEEEPEEEEDEEEQDSEVPGERPKVCVWGRRVGWGGAGCWLTLPPTGGPVPARAPPASQPQRGGQDAALRRADTGLDRR